MPCGDPGAALAARGALRRRPPLRGGQPGQACGGPGRSGGSGGIRGAGHAPLPSRSTELANGGQDGGRSADSKLRGRRPAPGSPSFHEETTFLRDTRPPNGNTDNAL